MKTKKLWYAFIAVMVISFSILGYYGLEIYHKAPPIPEQVVSADGQVLFTAQDIKDGQNVWQSIGGQELGTVWGHGSYVAPDWSADWLHREAVYILDIYAMRDSVNGFENMNPEKQAALKVRLQKEVRTNTYDANTGILKVSALRTNAINHNANYYSGLFTDEKTLEATRTAYAIPINTIKNADRMRKMNAFFFWTAWACVTNRPNSTISYTSNWPADELVANQAPPTLYFWSFFSIVVLLTGIGLLTFYMVRGRSAENESFIYPTKDPLFGVIATPSMKATLKYFWVVTGLILVQVIMGVVTAHYSVEGNGFFGLDLGTILPYSISRTWHVQIAIFWIATSWLATGLYIAPAVSGHEPKYQKLGVNFLFSALLVIVLGSLAGQWMGVMQKLGLIQNFWFGHQGYEYVDLGRFWQIFLFVGLIIWLVLMFRALLPALKQKAENRQLLIIFIIASIAIAAFYGAGLMWGRQTHLSVAEYWRWWVIHLWVEGFFEVFATVITAFIFVKLGLVGIRNATTAALFTTVIYLTGGILGTFHHLYFAGTPTAIIALGASFSALEVVPLVLVGFEAFHNWKLSKSTEWIKIYKWPIWCFIAVSFWNLVGAGLFGFLINPPIALYYMQGLNTTAVHGHTALFGVYGMLGIALMLFSLRGMTRKYEWKDKYIKIAFWSINIGLVLMVILSMLPVGIAQTVASVKYGMWYARSAEFLGQHYLVVFKWLRMIGDTVFSIGIIALAWFVVGLKTGWSLEKKELSE